MCIPNRWAKRGVERFGKTMDEASWFLREGSNHFTVSHSLFSTQLIFLLSSSLSPPAGAALSLSPWWSGHSVLGRKTLLTPGHRGECNTERQQPPKGECGSWGKWSWWWRVGRESSRSQTCVKAPLSLHSWEASGMLTDGMCWHCRWGGLGWGPTREGNTEATQTPEGFAGVWMVWAWWQAWWQPVVPLSHQPRTLPLVSVMGNLTPKHSCTQRWCTELLTNLSSVLQQKKQTNEISYEHFLLSNRNTKLNENLTKYFWTKIQIQTSGFQVIFMA